VSPRCAKIFAVLKLCADIPVQASAAAVAGVDCFIKNLSLRGAFIRSDCDFRLHTLIDVRIKLPPATKRMAVVRRISREHFRREWESSGVSLRQLSSKTCCGLRWFGSHCDALHGCRARGKEDSLFAVARPLRLGSCAVPRQASDAHCWKSGSLPVFASSPQVGLADAGNFED
jgi:hypothetical protein